MAVDAFEIGLAASRLAAYAVAHGIVEADDTVWAYNRLLECVGAPGPAPTDVELSEAYDFESDLACLAD
uniref:hypothetical protein n=1 Tax=Klebsiella pneumoniae TaxID=573 RepID=UPI0025A02496